MLWSLTESKQSIWAPPCHCHSSGHHVRVINVSISTQSLSQKFFRRFYLNFVVWNKNVKNVIIRDHYDNLKDFKLMLLKQENNIIWKKWNFSGYLWSINWPWKTGIVGRCLDSWRLQSKWEMKTLCFKLILLESWGLSIPMLLSLEWLKSIFYPAHVMIMNFNTLNCLS